MKTKIVILTFSILLLGFVSLSFSYDHVFYVDIVNGDNANDGSATDQAWENIYYAIGQINNDTNITTGQTTVLHVAPGTYPASAAAGLMDGNVVIRIDNVTIMGADAATTILDGTGADSAYWYEGVRTEDGINNATITGIAVRNFLGAGIRFYSGTGHAVNSCELSGNTHGVSVASAVSEVGFELNGSALNNNSYGIYIESTNAAVTATIKGNTVSANTNSGIYIVTGSGESSPIIKENSIFNNATAGIETMIGSAVSSPQILSNRIYDNQTGILLRGGSLTTSAPQVINNVIYVDSGTMTDGIVLNSSVTDSGLNATILHNTIDGGSGAGIYATTENPSPGPTLTADIRYCIISNFSAGASSYGIASRFTSVLDIDYVYVWNNTGGDFDNCSATNSINADPLYEADYSIPANSPCIDQIPAAVSDPVDYDIIGTSRPRRVNSSGTELHDIGAYEYPYQSYEFTMPGGTGLATDYRLMTLPLALSSGSLSTILTDAYGEYDDRNWRAFAWDGTAYAELGSTSFDTLTYNSSTASNAGRAFWIISLGGALSSDTNTFEGALTGNKDLQIITLQTGWNMVALPWAETSVNPGIGIGLSNIVVKDDTDKFYLTSGNNTLTEAAIWEYTGNGGYVRLDSASAFMEPGKGYWINVTSLSPVDLVIPPDNATVLTASKRITRKSATTSEPPPAPPGSNLSASGGNGCFIKSLLD